MEKTKGSLIALTGAAVIAVCLLGAPAQAEISKAAQRSAVIEYWTPARRADAQPRDMVIDHRGLGYLRRADGSLQPHGHRLEAQSSPVPRAKPGGGGGGSNDSEPPQILNLDPDGATIGTAHVFSAVVTDNVGLRSVLFIVTREGGNPQSFTATHSGNDVWTVSLSGFTDGGWNWQVEAKDTAKRGGNTATASASFTVDTAGGGGGGGGGDTPGVVTNAEWTKGGDVQTAVGRLFYEMPGNPRRKRWAGYVCSGTVVTDNETGRSVILTASHCVYDDANHSFARNVLFIPNQAQTTGTRTDSDCTNDPLGCYVADFGVVDENWTTRVFPDNVAWDYAFYVVEDGAASHDGAGGDVLDTAARQMAISFNEPRFDDDGNDGPGAPDYTHGMGYSYSDDPNFMYCAEDMTTESAVNWWLPSCDLSGGSSGGPWLQPFDEGRGNGPVISVNSWGYTTSPGMAGPILSGTSSASCVFAAAKTSPFVGNVADGDAGYAVQCP